ncbi:MAG: hypothetical protein ACPGU0_07450, partial [Marinirhabdus sp.]
EETIRIFTGSMMIGHGLKSLLNSLGIEPIIKDDHQSGITNGFAIGVPGQVRVFIRKDELARVKPEVEAYLNKIGEEE